MNLKNYYQRIKINNINYMAINETLKFSWGHIIAFVALIFISYVSFMGITYFTDGNFQYAGIGVLIVDLQLVLFFIVPQILKGTDEKFGRKIIIERILFFIAPVAFVVAMIPYIHFWTVFEKRTQIETAFTESIKATKEMFVSYETYAINRIENYDKELMHVSSDVMHKNNKVDALKLQLLDENYKALRNSAYKWIDNASGATVWNVFMIGNIKQIESAIENWNKSLNVYSSKRMSDESIGVEPFSPLDPSVDTAKSNLKELRSIYTSHGSPSLIALVSSICLYILLLFPYIIQSRNTKSTYRLIGAESKSRKSLDSSRDDMVFVSNGSSLDKGDYGSFTM